MRRTQGRKGAWVLTDHFSTPAQPNPLQIRQSPPLVRFAPANRAA